MRQRLAAVTGNVAHDHRHLAVLEREHVVEVSAGPRAVGGPVGDGGAHWAEPGGRNGQQRGLKQTHILEQLRPLALEPTRAHTDQTRAHARARARARPGPAMRIRTGVGTTSTILVIVVTSGEPPLVLAVPAEPVRVVRARLARAAGSVAACARNTTPGASAPTSTRRETARRGACEACSVALGTRRTTGGFDTPVTATDAASPGELTAGALGALVPASLASAGAGAGAGGTRWPVLGRVGSRPPTPLDTADRGGPGTLCRLAARRRSTPQTAAVERLCVACRAGAAQAWAERRLVLA